MQPIWVETLLLLFLQQSLVQCQDCGYTGSTVDICTHPFILTANVPVVSGLEVDFSSTNAFCLVTTSNGFANCSNPLSVLAIQNDLQLSGGNNELQVFGAIGMTIYCGNTPIFFTKKTVTTISFNFTGQAVISVSAKQYSFSAFITNSTKVHFLVGTGVSFMVSGFPSLTCVGLVDVSGKVNCSVTPFPALAATTAKPISIALQHFSQCLPVVLSSPATLTILCVSNSNCSIHQTCESGICMCPPGTFSSQLGATVCHNCSAGRYSSMQGASTCLNCTGTTVSMSAAATTCTDCAGPSHMVPNNNHTACVSSPCLPHPCSHSGTCQTTATAPYFNCTCPLPFVGKTCQFANLCLHGGLAVLS